jgi:hypothetical protein
MANKKDDKLFQAITKLIVSPVAHRVFPQQARDQVKNNTMRVQQLTLVTSVATNPRYRCRHQYFGQEKSMQ